MTTCEMILGHMADVLEMDVADMEETDYIQEDLGADSLDVTEFIMIIEDEFGISINEENSFFVEDRTVAEMLAYIEKCVNDGA